SRGCPSPWPISLPRESDAEVRPAAGPDEDQVGVGGEGEPELDGDLVGPARHVAELRDQIVDQRMQPGECLLQVLSRVADPIDGSAAHDRTAALDLHEDLAVARSELQ